MPAGNRFLLSTWPVHQSGDGSTNYYLNQLFTCEPYPATSYASPAVSGAIQLLWWYFQNR